MESFIQILLLFWERKYMYTSYMFFSLYVEVPIAVLFSNLKVNLFQPAHRRGEIISEQERDMEQAFEKLFVKTHGKYK